MHEKYAKDGLVVLSVTIDEDKDAKERASYVEKTNKYLSKVRPPFRTYDLDFDRERPPATLTFSDGNPRVFVFDRRNKFVLRLPEVDPMRAETKPVDYDAVEKAVGEAVKQR